MRRRVLGSLTRVTTIRDREVALTAIETGSSVAPASGPGGGDPSLDRHPGVE